MVGGDGHSSADGTGHDLYFSSLRTLAQLGDKLKVHGVQLAELHGIEGRYTVNLLNLYLHAVLLQVALLGGNLYERADEAGCRRSPNLDFVKSVAPAGLRALAAGKYKEGRCYDNAGRDAFLKIPVHIILL